MRRTAGLMVAAAGSANVFIPRWVFAQQTPEPNTNDLGSHMMDWGAEWYFMIFGLLFIILALVIVIAVALALFRGFGGARQQTPPEDYAHSALDILKERYVPVDITAQEFEERRRVIGH